MEEDTRPAIAAMALLLHTAAVLLEVMVMAPQDVGVRAVHKPQVELLLQELTAGEVRLIPGPSVLADTLSTLVIPTAAAAAGTAAAAPYPMAALAAAQGMYIPQQQLPTTRAAVCSTATII